MKKKKKRNKKLNKPTIFFFCLFIGFVSGTILGVGLNEIPIVAKK